MGQRSTACLGLAFLQVRLDWKPGLENQGWLAVPLPQDLRGNKCGMQSSENKTKKLSLKASVQFELKELVI